MTSKAEYTPDQWQLLLDVPPAVGTAVMVAGYRKIFDARIGKGLDDIHETGPHGIGGFTQHVAHGLAVKICVQPVAVDQSSVHIKDDVDHRALH